MLDRDEARANAVAAEVNGKPWVADVGDEKGLDDRASAIEDRCSACERPGEQCRRAVSAGPSRAVANVVADDVVRIDQHLCGRRSRSGGAWPGADAAASSTIASVAGACARCRCTPMPSQGGGHCHNRNVSPRNGAARACGSTWCRRATRSLPPCRPRSTKASVTSRCSPIIPHWDEWG